MKRSRLVFLVSTLAVLGIASYMLAIPTPSQFELDGNAVLDGATPPGDDWANTVPTKTVTSEAIATSFIADGSGNATIFTTGGSKDINDLNEWSFKDQLGGLPDKDNITNAYAAAYINAGVLTVYFGADRFANDGDAQMGFWFFKSRVQAIGGQFVGPDGVTAAQHTVGDILILANLTNGGAVVQAAVFKWVGGTNPLQLLTLDQDAKCGTNSDPNLCLISNDSPTPSPWPFTPKSGAAGTFPTFSFIEGGISAFVGSGADASCFSSFLAETRSSQSPTSTLKDFALGEFNTCKVDIAKTCPAANFNPTTGDIDYTYNVTVTNSGIGTLYDLTVNDTASGGYQKTLTLASLLPGTSHVFTETFSLTPGPTTPNPPTNTASVTAAASPGGAQVVTAGPVSAACPAVSFDASLTVTKFCASRLEVQNSKVVVAVDIQGQVCNMAPALPAVPSPIDNVAVTDTPLVVPSPIALGTLIPGQCKNYTATYFPSVLIGGSGIPHDQIYEDTVLAVGVSRFNGVTKQNTATARCPLCP